MNISRLIIILVFSVIYLPLTSAQKYLFDVKKINNEQGLSSLMTSTVCRDQQGFLWISTNYGLNRYDGYNVRQYTAEKHGLFSNDFIRKIQEDDTGKLWLFHFYWGGDKNVAAIDIFDPIQEKVISFDEYFKGKAPFLGSSYILTNINDPKKRLWLANNQGQLFVYEKGQFKKIFEHKGLLLKHIYVDQDDRIWLSFKNQIIHINWQGVIQKRLTVKDRIQHISVVNDTIWMATYKVTPDYSEAQLWLASINDTSFSPLVLHKEGKPCIATNRAYRTQQGFWYVVIDAQLQVFNSQGKWLFNFHTLLDQEDFSSFTDYLEIDNYMWFSTPVGVLRTHISPNPFQLIQAKEVLSDCRHITEDEKGNIYFLNTFLYQWSPQQQVLKQLSETRSHIGLIYTDSTIFSGFYSQHTVGYQLNLKTQEETIINSDWHDQLLTLIKTKKKNLYLAGQGKGLAYLDLSTKEYYPFEQYNDFELLKNANVYHFHSNHQGIWAATNIGLFLVNEQQGVLKHFNKNTGNLPFEDIRHIHEDTAGMFWMATKGGGILQWDPTSYKGQQFTTKDGLSNNYTYAIYEDDFGYLWIPSDQGLMCMHKQNHQVRTYLTNNGLPHNEFNQGSHYQAQDGTLYFGGLGGVIAFHPKQLIQRIQKHSPIAFTKLHLLESNKENITDKTSILQSSKVININPQDKFIEIHFTLLDFEDADKHQYKYQVQGYSNHWYTIKENYIRITHLPYGSYQLKIRGKNHQTTWSNQVLTLNINVLKPFYLQWWFLLGIFVLALALVGIFARWREQKIRKTNLQLEKEVQERTKTIQQQAQKLKELDKAKTRFFSNITHEFRTPLTLIIGPLEQLITASPSSKTTQKLNPILKNAQHLLRLINQLLDISKIEGGKMAIELSRGNLVGYTKELVQRFQPLAEKKQQQLHFISNKEVWETNFDRNKWDKIIYNLLSNAIKFTPSEKTIQLSLTSLQREGKPFIRLDVKDTGFGIEENKLKQIFNRFYQIDNSSTRQQDGTGIGLALVKELIELQGGNISVMSELHKGTSFEILLPVLDNSPLPVLPLVTDLKNVPNIPTIDPTTSTTQEITTVSDQTDKLELLIIEDNVEMRAYICSCIDPNLYNITEASNGEEGIEKALAQVPDLIISDVMMPQKDGFEVVQTIREHISTSHIPFILLTAKASLESRLKGLQKGADAYLTKPFSPQELNIRIQKLIEYRRILQERYQTNAPIPIHTSKEQKEEEEDPFIVELRAYILQHLDESNLSGDRIGKHFSISRVHLHRKLKALTNQPITDFVRSIRLQKALEFVQEGKLNVSEIAYQTGFSSISHFSRSFKKAYGKSPSKMQQHINN